MIGKRALHDSRAATSRRALRSRLCTAAAAWAVLLAASPAPAIEFFDGRMQIHGFYEMQVGVLAQNYDTVDGYNLAQWWHIANVELEWDMAPDGWGPFDFVSGYVRVEARYDCVWTKGCYMLPNYRSRYGDDATRLPNRISDANRFGLIGSIDPTLFTTIGSLDGDGDGLPDGVPNRGCLVSGTDPDDFIACNYADKRRRIQNDLGERAPPFGAPAGLDLGNQRIYHLGRNWNLPSIGPFFYPSPGRDGVWGTADDPGFYTLEKFTDYRWGLKELPGNIGDRNTQILGPHRPKDKVPKAGVLRDRANPFRGPCPEDAMGNPINDPSVCDLRPARGEPGNPDFLEPLSAGDELPFRPAPQVAYQQPGVRPAGLDTAQGMFVPNAGYRRLIKKNDFRARPDLNFAESELALNHGASQGPWNELKEAYLDIEMFDHRLWLRIGRQTIVWGKTELFRAQDQFNPQDVGLASLPSLEESRVPLWSARGIWSFYDVGPLSDVRLEVGINWDDFVPLDTGRCGEPYAPRPSCVRALGFLGNALTGTGLAGELRPGYPWESEDALEGGVRLEFRQDRFSYAITYWNGRSDVPYPKPVFEFSRNVDPLTGRPRDESSNARCNPVGSDISGCLGTVDFDVGPGGRGLVGNPDDPATPFNDALERHHANLQILTTLCGATVTFTDLVLEACGFNAWNFTNRAAEPDPTDPLTLASPTVSMAFSSILAGQGPDQTGLPEGNLFRGLNGKQLLFQLGRFNDYYAAAPDIEDDLPLVPLQYGDGDDSNNGDDLPVDRIDYDRPEVVGALGPPADPLNSADDAFFCSRLDVRIQDERRVENPDGSFNCNATAGIFPNTVYNFWRPYGLARYLTDEQEAIVGCGRFWGTDCDVDGFDLLNAEASAFYQSWPGIEGTEGGVWDTYGRVGRELPDGSTTFAQPGTTGFVDFQGPICNRGRLRLPGCEGANGRAQGFPDLFDPPDPNNPRLLNDAPDLLAGHPFTGQNWRSETAALSWNALMAFVALSVVSEDDDQLCFEEQGNDLVETACPPGQVGDGLNDDFQREGLPGRFDELNPLSPFALDRCSFRNPIICRSVAAILQVSQTTAKSVRAGGNGRFGRRDFVWHGGAQAVLDYNRQSVTGIAMDFAEDRTKSNWNIEFTWFRRVRFVDNGARSLNKANDTLNLTLSVDRPTFIRFLNRNRTFFFNAQLFLQGIVGWESSYVANGPVNALMTFSIVTGYYQDRFLPSVQLVYDVGSESGAFLYGFAFRITQSFQVQAGMNAFWGRSQRVVSPVVPVGTTGIGVGRGAGSQNAFVENGLSPVRDRDEIFLRLRWTF